MLTSQALTSWYWHVKCVFSVRRSSLCVCLISSVPCQLLRADQTRENCWNTKEHETMKKDSSSHTDYRSKASSHHIKKLFEMKENSEKIEPYLFAEGRVSQSLQGFQTILSWPSFGCCFVMKDRKGKNWNAGSRSVKIGKNCFVAKL